MEIILWRFYRLILWISIFYLITMLKVVSIEIESPPKLYTINSKLAAGNKKLGQGRGVQRTTGKKKEICDGFLCVLCEP